MTTVRERGNARWVGLGVLLLVSLVATAAAIGVLLFPPPQMTPSEPGTHSVAARVTAAAGLLVVWVATIAYARWQRLGKALAQLSLAACAVSTVLFAGWQLTSGAGGGYLRWLPLALIPTAAMLVLRRRR